MTDPYSFTDDGLAQALAGLGDSKDAVAETLTAGGWRGRRDECSKCPVAVYLMAKFGKSVHVDVGPYAVSIDRDVWVDDGYGMGHMEHHVAGAIVSHHLGRFLLDFDKGRAYSHLEAA